MITLYANIPTTIFEFLPDYDFYFFAFELPSCEIETVRVEPDQHCAEFVVFSPSVELARGVYPCKIYGSNTDDDTLVNADFLKAELCKVIDAPECMFVPAILDENGYPITDINDILINYRA